MFRKDYKSKILPDISKLIWSKQFSGMNAHSSIALISNALSLFAVNLGLSNVWHSNVCPLVKSASIVRAGFALLKFNVTMMSIVGIGKRILFERKYFARVEQKSATIYCGKYQKVCTRMWGV